MHSSVFYLQDRRLPFKSRAGFSCASQCGSLGSVVLIDVEPSQGPAAVIRTADTSSAINSHGDLELCAHSEARLILNDYPKSAFK